MYMTDSSLPFAATNFTAEIFMRVDRAVSYSVIMAKKRAGGFSWAVNVLTSGELRVRMDTNLPGETDGFNKSFSPGADSQVEDGKWHHVALTYDAGTEQGEVFVDYESVGSFTSPVNPLYFDEGDYIIGAGDRAFDGWLDEFRLSGKVLAPDQFLRVVSEGGTVIVIY